MHNIVGRSTSVFLRQAEIRDSEWWYAKIQFQRKAVDAHFTDSYFNHPVFVNKSPTASCDLLVD